MGQQLLIYSFVAQGNVILAEYTEFTGNFTSIAAQCLQKLPSSNNKFTYNCDGHTFNYLVEDGYTYCVVAVETAGRQVPIAFRIGSRMILTRDTEEERLQLLQLTALTGNLGQNLKSTCSAAWTIPRRLANLQKLRPEVKGVMMENIEKVLDCGEKIELLVDKTENLRSQVKWLKAIMMAAAKLAALRLKDLPSGNHQRGIEIDKGNRVFQLLDKNGDDKISLEELTEVVEEIGVEQEDADELMQLLDANQFKNMLDEKLQMKDSSGLMADG